MIILPITAILLMNIALMQLTHKKFGDVIPSTLILDGFIMYLGQYLFGTFAVGIALILIWAVVGLALLVFQRDRLFLLSPGCIAFLGICAIVVIFDFHRHYSDFDELWHWGMMIRESLRLDSFFCVSESRMVIHKDYPPFLCLVELIFVKLSGKYAEDLASMGVHIFSLSVLFCPVSEKIASFQIHDKRDWGQMLKRIAGLLIFGIGIVNFFDYAHIAGTILADIPLALMLSYAMFLILTEDAYRSVFGAVCLALSVSALSMIKQAGVPLALLVIFTYVLVGGICRLSSFRQLALTAVAGLCGMAGSYFSWSFYVKKCNIADIRAAAGGGGQFDASKYDFREYFDIVLKRESGQRADTFWNYIHALVGRRVNSAPWFQLSFVGCLFLILLFLLILYLLFANIVARKKVISLMVASVAGFAGYAFMLSVLFVFCFTSDEMAELRGYERYMDGLILGMILAFALWVFVMWLQRDRALAKGQHTAVILAVTILMMNGYNLYYLCPQMIRPDTYSFYRQMGETIAAEVKDDATIAMVYNTAEYGWNGFVQSCVYQYVNYCDLPWNMNLYSDDYQNPDVCEKAEKVLSEADYIYFLSTNESMNDFFSEINQGEALKTQTLYKIAGGKIEVCH